MSRSVSKKGNRSENRITLILIRGLGNLRTYDLSVFWFRLVGALVICLALAVAGLGYQNYALRQDRQRLVSQLFLDASIRDKTDQGAPAGRLTADRTDDQTASQTDEGKQTKAARDDNDQASDQDNRQGVQASETAKPAGPPEAANPAAASDGKKADKSPAASDQVVSASKIKGKTSDKETEQDQEEAEADKAEASAEAGAADNEAAKSSKQPEAKSEGDAAKLAAAVAENLAEDSLSSDQLTLDSIRTMRLAQPKGIKISYKIRNLIGGGRRISGYAFMIGLNNNQEPVKAFPAEAMLDDGKPVNFKQGRYFSIRQYTTIRGRIYSDDDISYIRILIYDLTGQLVMTKQFGADDV